MDNDAKQLLTVAHLKEFKVELLAEVKLLLKSGNGSPEKKWLKSKEVRTQLKVSTGTLQTMRKSGSITFTKIGGVIYYSQEDIDEMLEKYTVHAKP